MPGTFKRLLHYQDHVYGAVKSSWSIMLKCFYRRMMLRTTQQLCKNQNSTSRNRNRHHREQAICVLESLHNKNSVSLKCQVKSESTVTHQRVSFGGEQTLCLV